MARTVQKPRQSATSRRRSPTPLTSASSSNNSSTPPSSPPPISKPRASCRSSKIARDPNVKADESKEGSSRRKREDVESDDDDDDSEGEDGNNTSARKVDGGRKSISKRTKAEHHNDEEDEDNEQLDTAGMLARLIKEDPEALSKLLKMTKKKENSKDGKTSKDREKSSSESEGVLGVDKMGKKGKTPRKAAEKQQVEDGDEDEVDEAAEVAEIRAEKLAASLAEPFVDAHQANTDDIERTFSTLQDQLQVALEALKDEAIKKQYEALMTAEIKWRKEASAAFHRRQTSLQSTNEKMVLLLNKIDGVKGEKKRLVDEAKAAMLVKLAEQDKANEGIKKELQQIKVKSRKTIDQYLDKEKLERDIHSSMMKAMNTTIFR